MDKQVEKRAPFDIAVENSLRTIFPRMESAEFKSNELGESGMIAHITLYDKELRVVDGGIMEVKVKRNLIAEPSKKDPSVYYIFDTVEGTFRIQFIFDK